MSEIQEPPTEVVQVDNTGIKNLAGWLARYYKLGVLNQSEQSDFVSDALNSGSFVHYQPVLQKCVNGGYHHWGSAEEYEKYEFSVRLEIFGTPNEFFDVCFQFKSGDKVSMYSEGEAEASDAIKTFSEVLDLDILKDKVMTWMEADQIILSYVKYLHALGIQPAPKE